MLRTAGESLQNRAGSIADDESRELYLHLPAQRQILSELANVHGSAGDC
ncbi:MAG: hypothetical protein GWP61_04130 [Chloroflexi bacterium]|nr:hypothetical protein [Chloroflexota bacterium]